MRSFASQVSVLALAAALVDAGTWPDRVRAIESARRAHEEALAWEVHLQPDGARRAQLHRDWKARHIAAQRGLCHYCATPFDDAEHQATIDHVEPIARGGGDVFENTVAACRRCNTAKRDLDPREFLAALQMHRRGIVTPVSHAIGHSGAGTGSAGTAFSPSGT